MNPKGHDLLLIKPAALFFFFWFISSGCLAQKPDLLLPKVYSSGKNVVGWVMSEKLDGVRAYWDGKTLSFRSGKKIMAPDWFIKALPDFALDGELWTKRDDFANISSIVRAHEPDEQKWKQVGYYIFEVPRQQGNLFQRLAVLKHYLKHHDVRFIHIIPQIKINSLPQMERFYRKLLKQKAEGIIVRDPNLPYQTGRRSSILKRKPYQDADCVVKAIFPGKGKLRDKMGSLLCQMNNGVRLRIGTGFTLQQRRNPPDIGDLVTFKYYGLTKNNIPRFPVFMRIRSRQLQ